DKHCRYFFRLLSKHAMLYTEMITTGAILHGHTERFLQFSDCEHPVALQLGGSNPTELAQCARLAAQYGYDEINLNVGCPSNRVQSGRFGACLMAEPQLVAHCVAAMQEAVSLPITVKTRIGIDDHDSYEHLTNFIDTVSKAGCELFIMHARKAWLHGLSPKENREVPPLRYDVVYHLKKDFPHLTIILNGGIKTLDDAQQHLHSVDGVMLGRAIYHNSYLLADVDRLFYGETDSLKPTREVIMDRVMMYVEEQRAQGVATHHITRHVLGLFHGQPGARRSRRSLGS
ncbi:MAG: tRNA dihydrouridine(20/20a) synthase DusA, partial [Gammaproteobacteria bacterium]